MPSGEKRFLPGIIPYPQKTRKTVSGCVEGGRTLWYNGDASEPRAAEALRELGGIGMKIIRDIVYGETGQCLDIYLPDGGATGDAFLYFHGGGLEAGNRKIAEVFAPRMTAEGIAVLSADYRLYPEAKYPDFIEDAADAVAWAADHMKEYGAGERLFVGGSSAGAYLSMMLCFDRKYLDRHGIAPERVSGFLHDAGQPTCHFNVLRERGIDTRRVIVDESSPMWHVGLRTEYPPMLFLVADHDMQNRYEQTVLMLSTMRHFGCDMEKARLLVLPGKHCKYRWNVDENGENFYGKLIADFIRECTDNTRITGM